MDGVILASGDGSRVSHVIKAKQKCLLKFKEKPLAEHVVDYMYTAGLDQIYMVVGYKADEITDYFKGAGLTFLVDNQFNDTSKSLILAERYLSDQFIVSQAEI